MKKLVLRGAICAASLIAFVPAAASAQDTQATTSAVATGLAIPIAGIPNAHRASTPMRGRSILIDAAAARLYMLENGRVVDSMRVIVGKPDTATPELRSTIYYATLNPYWNVTDNLTRTLIAPNVLRLGYSYLRDRGYEVISNFGRDAEIIPAEEVDWKAVAAGREHVKVRQRPGPANSMGEVKFGFPNNDGIYLHDTPRKELFDQDDRALSHGCVRLEDAERLTEWLLGRDPDTISKAPEQFVPLPAAVPIVITYSDAVAPSQVAALR